MSRSTMQFDRSPAREADRRARCAHICGHMMNVSTAKTSATAEAIGVAWRIVAFGFATNPFTIIALVGFTFEVAYTTRTGERIEEDIHELATLWMPVSLACGLGFSFFRRARTKRARQRAIWWASMVGLVFASYMIVGSLQALTGMMNVQLVLRSTLTVAPLIIGLGQLVSIPQVHLLEPIFRRLIVR